MSDRFLISKLYRKFCEVDGNQHIASEYAIIKIQEIIERFNIKRVLEVGLGVGSIAGTLLRLNNNIIYSGTESNEFCINALAKNLGEKYQKLSLYNSLNSVPENEKFDLIIVDGKDKNLKAIRNFVSKAGIIILEGDRKPQEKAIHNIFEKNVQVHSISLSKNKSYSPFPTSEWQGGLKIIFVNPTFLQYVWWIKEKIKTKLKYKFPGRYFGT